MANYLYPNTASDFSNVSRGILWLAHLGKPPTSPCTSAAQGMILCVRLQQQMNLFDAIKQQTNPAGEKGHLKELHINLPNKSHNMIFFAFNNNNITTGNIYLGLPIYQALYQSLDIVISWDFPNKTVI